jgi:lipoprotein NlpD
MTLRATALSAYLILALATGCATTQRAPVVERSGGAPATATTRPSQPAAGALKTPTTSTAPAAPAPSAAPANPPSEVVVARAQPSWDPNDPRPDFHSVQRGETLFGIALAYGLTYREIAEWNGLAEPYVIKVGQQLRLRAAQNNVTVIPAKPTSVDSTTIITDQTQEAGTLGGGEIVTPAPAQAPAPSAPATTPAPQSGAAAKVVATKSEPKALKLPYTEANWSRFESDALPLPAAKSAAPIVERSATKPAEKPVETIALPSTQSAAKPESAPQSTALAAPSVVVEGVEWAWPAPSKVANGFSDVSKGIALTGSLGQSVLASAAGQVSYVGNSLRGYGKMIVIKHNKMFLSVYAHNSKVFVKEGQNVGKGQKIAEMGNTDSEGVVLHFEIRRYGKPVDPLKYLPNGASS